MRRFSLAMLVVLAATLVGCTSAEDKQANKEADIANAQADLNEKKQELYGRYNDSVWFG